MESSALIHNTQVLSTNAGPTPADNISVGEQTILPHSPRITASPLPNIENSVAVQLKNQNSDYTNQNNPPLEPKLVWKVKENYKHSVNIQPNETSNEADRKRDEKIEFLGKVIYEFIERTVYHNIKIDVNMIQKKALEIREAIAISKFSPNRFWFSKFKTAYKLFNFDLANLKKTIIMTKPKEPSLNCIHLIQYVIDCEKAELKLKKSELKRQQGGSNVTSTIITKKLETHYNIDGKLQLYHKQLEKIDFLGKVIFEFLKRAVYQNKDIDINIVKAKALEVKQAIALTNFFPNSFWIEKFKTTYKITNFDLLSLKQTNSMIKPEESTLNCIDLIRYVSLCKEGKAKQLQQDLRDSEDTAKQSQINSQCEKNFESVKKNYTEARNERRDKIEFLDKVIYEFVERSVYYSIKIDTNAVIKKALQVKNTIVLSSFVPNHFWIRNFMAAYKITNFDLASLRKTISFTQPKERSFKCSDLIQHVIEFEKAQTEQKFERVENIAGVKKNIETSIQPQHDFEDVEMRNFDNSMLKHEIDCDDAQYSGIEEKGRELEFISLNGNDGLTATSKKPPEETFILKHEIDIDDTQFSDSELNGSGAEFMGLDANVKLTDTNENPTAILSSITVPHIANGQDAMIYLKALEEFAMLSDNYRAIGLITQLEEALSKGVNDSVGDFH